MTKRAPDNEGQLETKEPEAKRARGDGKGTRPPLFDPAHRYAMWTVMYPDADESEVFLLQLGSAPPEREARFFTDFEALAQRVADGRKNYCPAVLAVWSGQATFQAVPKTLSTVDVTPAGRWQVVNIYEHLFGVPIMHVERHYLVDGTTN